MKIDPAHNSSMENIIDQSKRKVLLGPGYYNVNDYSNKKVAPSYSFEKDTAQIIDPNKFDDYMRDNQ